MIKVGDWVLIDGRVGRVTRGSTPDDFHTWIEVDGVSEVVRDVEKLPIKFKALDIGSKVADKFKWECYRTQKGVGNIHFICIQEGKNYFVTGFKVPNDKFLSSNCTTIDQAKAWLELQYATMLAKARGLV